MKSSTAPPRNSVNLKKKASLSLQRILYDILDPDLPDFDDQVEELSERLIEEGPVVMQTSQHITPNVDETTAILLNDKAYQDYLKSVPSLAHFVLENAGLIGGNQEQDNKGNNKARDSAVTANGINSSVNNALLVEIVEKIKSKEDKYDDNFTLTYDFKGHSDLKKETIILSILKNHLQSDFATLFMDLRPLLFDLLKRREGFEDFIQTLRRLSKLENIAAQNIIKQLEVRDIIVLLVESCTQKSMPKLGAWLTLQFYPLPLAYLLGKNDYKFNLDCCLEHMFQVKLPMVTSIGTKNAMGIGKSSLLSYIFSTKSPGFFSTVKGYTHFGSIDLYVKLPSEGQKFIVADVHNYGSESEFHNIASKVLMSSQVVIVHITTKDIKEEVKDIKINLGEIKIPQNVKILYLLRDFDEDTYGDLLKKLEDILAKDNSCLGIIPVQKLNGEQSFEIQNQKLEVMQIVFKKLSIFDNQAYAPIENIKKLYELPKGKPLEEGDLLKDSELDEEKKIIQDLLDQEMKNNPNASLIKTLFPCLWMDYKILEEMKKIKVIDRSMEDMSQKQLKEWEERFHSIEGNIQKYKTDKDNVKVSKLTREVLEILSSNNLYRILLLSEIINNWKMPQFMSLKNKYMELCAVKNDNAKGLTEEEKKLLVEQMDDKDISLSTFLDEVLSLYESKAASNLKGYDDIKQYVISSLEKGDPVNLVNGKTLKFGSKLFQEVFDKDEDSNRKIFVISIIGAQSSAKSSLLNVLFGCGFSTSAGRCTKGLYISVLHHSSGFRIVVIDTEGLLSVVARDQEFDNLITTMTFSCSHVVIINNMGQINTRLRDLLEICVYAMRHLKLAFIKPKIIFALRDIADNSAETQQEMLLAMKSSLEQAANRLSIDFNSLIDFSQEDIFLLPSAFQPVEGENKQTVQLNNNLFSSRVLEMRQYIFSYLATVESTALLNLKWFYHQTGQLWGDITELGKDIMRAKNFLEIELKDDALEKVSMICKKHKEVLVIKGQSLVKHERGQLKSDSQNSVNNFEDLLRTDFTSIRNAAMAELDNQIFKNDKYAAIGGYFQEFRDILEYYLRWQNQRFLNEWKASLLSWKTDKEIAEFKTKVKANVNEKIKNSDMNNITDEIYKYFKDLKQKLKADFTKNMDSLRATNTQKLPAEIHNHYDCGQQVKNKDKHAMKIQIPSLADVLSKINSSHLIHYNPRAFVRYSHKKALDHDEESEMVEKAFRTLLTEIDIEIGNESSEDIAITVLTLCMSHIKKLESAHCAVNPLPFMHFGVLEAMHKQYLRTKEVELKRIQEKQRDLEDVLNKEELHIQDLLDLSKDSFVQGQRCAKKWFKEIKSEFCKEQEQVIQDAVMKKIQEEFPDPEEANKKAYANSFTIMNFENVLKYVFNINKFIREIYDEKIKVISHHEIEKNLESQTTIFIQLIKQAIGAIEQWSEDHKNGEYLELGTLIEYIYRNEGLKEYFPELYTIKIGDIKTFSSGCVKELAEQIKKSEIKDELRKTIDKKIQEYLANQYSTLVGCQERCPQCHNKCIKGDNVHKDHHTNCHLLQAFSGTHNKDTKEADLIRCFDPSNYACRWWKGERMYQTYDEFISIEYPEWRKEFPTKEQAEKQVSSIPAELIECWVGTKDVLIQYYQYKDSTPKGWLEQVDVSRRLKPNVVVKGYING